MVKIKEIDVNFKLNQYAIGIWDQSLFVSSIGTVLAQGYLSNLVEIQKFKVKYTADRHTT